MAKRDPWNVRLHTVWSCSHQSITTVYVGLLWYRAWWEIMMSGMKDRVNLTLSLNSWLHHYTQSWSIIIKVFITVPFSIAISKFVITSSHSITEDSYCHILAGSHAIESSITVNYHSSKPLITVSVKSPNSLFIQCFPFLECLCHWGTPLGPHLIYYLYTMSVLMRSAYSSRQSLRSFVCVS